MKFESLNIHPDLLRGIDDAGFERCTPVQEQSLPECLAGKDLISQSQTGTGKTAVFVITIYNRLLLGGWESSGKPRALVIAPTRELAVQIEHDARILGRHLPLRSVVIYGGVEYEKQVSALKSGVDLVVATPGRMIDLYKTKRLSLDSIDMFVIDEADRMFDMGFAPDVRYIAGRLPKKRPRQTMLFSATIDSNVYRLSSRYMKPDAILVEIEPEQVTVDTIDQKIFYVSNEEKLSVLMGLLKREDAERVIIFTNMKRTAEMLEWKLIANGFPAKVLTGDVTQARRQKVIDRMKSGELRILVATDVVARGLHIEDVSHVINYDLPDETASYVHRIGRTARVGKSGKAYSLVCEDHVLNLPEIEKYIENKIETEWMETSEMVEDKSGEWRGSRRRAKGAKGESGRGAVSGQKHKSPSRAGKPPPRRTGRPPERKKRDAPSTATGDKGAMPPERKKRNASSTATGDKGAVPPERKKRQASPSDGKKGAGSKRRRKGRAQRPPERKSEEAQKDSPEARLAYYRKKYGEEFSPGTDTKAGKSKKGKSAGRKKGGGVLKRILKKAFGTK
jgi:ATP-dependent RNA helicase RhlB